MTNFCYILPMDFNEEDIKQKLANNTLTKTDFDLLISQLLGEIKKLKEKLYE